VLYFLLCGKPPFEGDNASALAFAHVHEQPVAPSRKLGRQLPSDVEGAVMRALQKDPASRFDTAVEFALALASCTLAGKWTFGDAALVARNSSRPPPPGILESMPSLRAPRVPNLSPHSESGTSPTAAARPSESGTSPTTAAARQSKSVASSASSRPPVAI
jgi:serine/threonine protein kinase